MKVAARSFVLFFSVVWFTSVTYAQQSKERFSEILVNATKLYEQGNFTEAITLLTSMSLDGANLSEKWNLKRILAMTYLADNKQELAKHAAEDMLEINPTYKPSSLNEHADLIKLLKSIPVIPKYSLGLALSINTNTTYPEITTGYIVSDYVKKYTPVNSFQFGLSVGYALNSKMKIDLGAYASQKAYNIKYSMPNWAINVNERLTYIDVPLLFKYSFRLNKKLHVYPQAGAFAGYLLFSSNDFSSTYTPDNKKYELNSLNSEQRRNKYNLGLVGGLGLGFETSQGCVFLQANYFKSYSQITKADTRFKYAELTYTYFYADDDMLLNNLAVSIGYSHYMNYKVIRK